MGTSEHLDDKLAETILKGKAQRPINPHSQRLLAASKKPVSLKLKENGQKGTAAKTKAKPKKRPAASKASAKAKAQKKDSENVEASGSKAMSSKEITTYYSSTKQWFMEKWGSQLAVLCAAFL